MLIDCLPVKEAIRANNFLFLEEALNFNFEQKSDEKNIEYRRLIKVLASSDVLELMQDDKLLKENILKLICNTLTTIDITDPTYEDSIKLLFGNAIDNKDLDLIELILKLYSEKVLDHEYCLESLEFTNEEISDLIDKHFNNEG